jgi:hypothetical protein
LSSQSSALDKPNKKSSQFTVKNANLDKSVSHESSTAPTLQKDILVNGSGLDKPNQENAANMASPHKSVAYRNSMVPKGINLPDVIKKV